MSDYWSRSEYDDIERDARAEARYFGLDEHDGPDADELDTDIPTVTGTGWGDPAPVTVDFGEPPF